MDLYTLPKHVLVIIFMNLDNKAKFSVALTCRYFNDIVKKSPEVYETFQLDINWNIENKIEEINTITRPIPALRLRLINIFPAVLDYLEKQGKFLKDVYLRSYNNIDYNVLIKMLNLIPNTEKLHLSLSSKYRIPIVEDDAELVVKNRFVKLKSLQFDIKPDNLPLKIFYEFFKDAREISELELSHNLNLFYNKPKLEKMTVSSRKDFKLQMDAASESNVICRNLKKISIKGHGFNNFENLESFVKAQFGIREVTIEDFYADQGSFRFQNILSHVLNLSSLKKFDFLCGLDIIVSMTSHPGVEELTIYCDKIHQFVTIFPNLKKLTLVYFHHFNNNVISVLNQFKFLEELTLDSILNHTPKIDVPVQLPNLRMLTIQADSSNKQLLEFFAINCPNITDITYGLNFKETENIVKFSSIMKKFENLKRFTCNIWINIENDNFDKIENFDIFVDAGKNLEKFDVQLFPIYAYDGIRRKTFDYYAKFKPFVTFNLGYRKIYTDSDDEY